MNVESAMSKSVVILGTQWGDEGKGKIVDLLTDRVAGVVRFQGGHNAGHTLIIGGEKTDGIVLKKGDEMRLSYRVVLHDGGLDSDQAAADSKAYSGSPRPALN